MIYLGHATLSIVVKELKSLRNDVLALKYALIPTIKLRPKHAKEIRAIRKEMESGKERAFEEVFGK